MWDEDAWNAYVSGITGDWSEFDALVATPTQRIGRAFSEASQSIVELTVATERATEAHLRLAEAFGSDPE